MQTYAAQPSRNASMASPAPMPAQRPSGLQQAPALAVVSTPLDNRANDETCCKPVAGFSSSTYLGAKV